MNSLILDVMKGFSVESEKMSESFCCSDVSDLDVPDLNCRIDHVMTAIKKLEYEKLMYERYIKKVGVDNVYQEHANEPSFPIPVRRSRSATADVVRYLQLPVEYKCRICQNEMEEIRQETRILKNQCEKAIDVYRAVAEEAEVRAHEMKKVRNQFDIVVREGYSERMKCVTTEKLVRYVNDRLLKCDVLTDQIRLCNVALRTKLKKLNVELRQQMQTSDSLTKSDFDTLVVECKQAAETMSEKNAEVASMKLRVARTNQVLTYYKMRLAQTSHETPQLMAEFIQQKKFAQHVANEFERIYDAKQHEAKICENLQYRQANFHVPTVANYVDCVAEDSVLTQKLVKMKHRKHVAKLKLRLHKGMWKQLHLGEKSLMNKMEQSN